MSVTLFSIGFSPYEDWATSEKRLREYALGHGITELIHEPSIQNLIRETNAPAFVEMSIQRQYPFTVVSGFLGIEKVLPEQSFLGALRIAWNTDDLSSLPILIPTVYSRLSQPVFAADAELALTSVMQTNPRNQDCVLPALQSIGPTLLQSWLAKLRIENCVPSTVAFVVEICAGDPVWNMPDNVRGLLRDFREIPGVAQLTYLEYYAPVDNEFLASLKKIMEANVLDEASLRSIATRRQVQLTTLLNNTDWKLAPEARSRILRAMSGNPSNK